MVKKPELSKGQVIAELESEIQVYWNSYKENDGVVRDKRALRTMAALGDALPKETARVRKLITIYRAIGPAGNFAIAMMQSMPAARLHLGQVLFYHRLVRAPQGLLQKRPGKG